MKDLYKCLKSKDLKGSCAIFDALDAEHEVLPESAWEDLDVFFTLFSARAYWYALTPGVCNVTSIAPGFPIPFDIRTQYLEAIFRYGIDPFLEDEWVSVGVETAVAENVFDASELDVFEYFLIALRMSLDHTYHRLWLEAACAFRRIFAPSPSNPMPEGQRCLREWSWDSLAEHATDILRACYWDGVAASHLVGGGAAPDASWVERVIGALDAELYVVYKDGTTNEDDSEEEEYDDEDEYDDDEDDEDDDEDEEGEE